MKQTKFDERVVTFGHSKSLIGILTLPANSLNAQNPVIIMLNAGLIHRIGPNRLHVNLSREFAIKGIPCFRFDFSGFGDSTSINYASLDQRVDEIEQAISYLETQLGKRDLILFGVCSGAENAYHCALNHQKVTGCILINGIYLSDEEQLNYSAQIIKLTQQRYYKKKVWSLDNWINVLSGNSSLFSHLFRKFQVKDRENFNNPPEYTVKWENLLNREIKINIIYSEGSNALDVYNLLHRKELQRIKKPTLFDVNIIENVDHVFTPIWSQDYLFQLLDSWIIKNWKLN